MMPQCSCSCFVGTYSRNRSNLKTSRPRIFPALWIKECSATRTEGGLHENPNPGPPTSPKYAIFIYFKPQRMHYLYTWSPGERAFLSNRCKFRGSKALRPGLGFWHSPRTLRTAQYVSSCMQGVLDRILMSVP